MENIIEALGEAFHFVMNPQLFPSPYFEIWWTVRAGFVLVSAFFIGMLIYLYFVSDYKFYRFSENIKEYKSFKPDWGIKIEHNWEEIKKNANHEKEAERKLSIIEADDMVDNILGQLGYQGQDLIEKLEGLNKDIIPLIEELKEAHRIKRDLVYDPNKSIDKKETERLIGYYEETIKDLQII